MRKFGIIGLRTRLESYERFAYARSLIDKTRPILFGNREMRVYYTTTTRAVS